VPVIDTMELETKEQSKPTEVVQIRDTEIETLVKTCAIEELQNVIGLALAHHVYPNWTKLLEFVLQHYKTTHEHSSLITITITGTF